MMPIAYPVTLTPDDNGMILVTFPDFPGATFGADRDDALRRAADALATIVEMYQRDGKPLPASSGGAPRVSPSVRDDSHLVRTAAGFLDFVFEQLELWHQRRPAGAPGVQPWFRGEVVAAKPLLPKLYRRDPPYGENDLLQHFRRMATLPHLQATLDREAIDLWLYLARHSGLPTRLLDWTEGALTALYFAASESQPARVWMLMPQPLNIVSGVNGFEVPWHRRTRTAGAIRAAWEGDHPDQPDLPLAIYPMHVHPRLQVQQSCFTIHGRRKEPLDVLMAEAGLNYYLRAFDLHYDCHKSILEELRILGISQASLFPDLDGLAADLTSQFWRPGRW